MLKKFLRVQSAVQLHHRYWNTLFVGLISSAKNSMHILQQQCNSPYIPFYQVPTTAG